MVTKWDTVLFKEETDQSTFDRYKLRVCRMFIHIWTSSPLQNHRTTVWILRITSVGDLFPAVRGICSVYWGAARTFRCMYNMSRVRTPLQSRLLQLLVKFGLNLSQVMLDLRNCFLFKIPFRLHNTDQAAPCPGSNVQDENLCYRVTVPLTFDLTHADTTVSLYILAQCQH